MRCQKAILIAGALALACGGEAREFSGARALEYTRRAVALGPRPPGSAAIRALQARILGELKLRGCRIEEDAFTAQTPIGAVPMKNLIAVFPGRSGRAVAITGHYDTKRMPEIRFVGADDGGSSTGFLLEMAAALQGRDHKDDIYLVWFDGEEAFGEWSDTNGIYGSRHLARKWMSNGTLARFKAIINVDMIGDRNLNIMQEYNSTAWLRKLVWDTASRLGYGKYFMDTGGATEDDHMPFLRLGAPALDLIDFDKTYWHTPEDTMDKLSAHSFEVVGTVLLDVLGQLEGHR
ncbi:MAG: M28 family peptidase [Bryobacteraceae bacterium]